MLNYFGADKTRKCLESLACEDLASLILVDNSACDEERAKIAAMLCEVSTSGVRFPMRPLYNDENLGFGKGINRAIAMDHAANGGHDYYLLINNDAEATPGLVAELVSAAVLDQRILLLAPRIRWGGEVLGYYWYQPLLGEVSRAPLPGSFAYLSGCCLLVSASLLESNGRLFDEAFFMYGEDVELTARALRTGGRIACIDHLLAIHEGTGSSSQGKPFYEYHVARGHILLARMLAQNPRQRTLMLLGRMIFLTARAFLRALRYRTTVPLRALTAAWKGTGDHFTP